MLKLETISQQLGLKRGQDKYWEFVFPATNILDEHLNKIKTLLDSGLLPKDKPLSLHLTIGGLDREYAFAVLYFYML